MVVCASQPRRGVTTGRAHSLVGLSQEAASYPDEQQRRDRRGDHAGRWDESDGEGEGKVCGALEPEPVQGEGHV